MTSYRGDPIEQLIARFPDIREGEEYEEWRQRLPNWTKEFEFNRRTHAGQEIFERFARMRSIAPARPGELRATVREILAKEAERRREEFRNRARRLGETKREAFFLYICGKI
jgi:hypothetical protein